MSDEVCWDESGVSAGGGAARKTDVPRRALTIEEACQALAGISKPIIYQEIKAGRLRTFRVKSRRLVSLAAIDDYIAMAERETAPPSPKSGNLPAQAK